MLRAEDNKFLTESGAGNGDGRIAAPVLDAGAAVGGIA